MEKGKRKTKKKKHIVHFLPNISVGSKNKWIGLRVRAKGKKCVCPKDNREKKNKKGKRAVESVFSFRLAIENSSTPNEFSLFFFLPCTTSKYKWNKKIMEVNATRFRDLLFLNPPSPFRDKFCLLIRRQIKDPSRAILFKFYSLSLHRKMQRFQRVFGVSSGVWPTDAHTNDRWIGGPLFACHLEK